MRPRTVDRERKRQSCFQRRSSWLLTAAVVALSTVALGCAGQEGQTAGELTPQEEQALADTLELQARNLLATWSELEPEPYLQLFSEDLQFYFQGWIDREEFEKRVPEIMDGYSEYSTEIRDPKIEVLGRDAGVASLIYRAQPVDTAGESHEFEAVFTLVYERRDGRWKVVQVHESLVPQEESE